MILTYDTKPFIPHTASLIGDTFSPAENSPTIRVSNSIATPIDSTFPFEFISGPTEIDINSIDFFQADLNIYIYHKDPIEVRFRSIEREGVSRWIELID